jgi:transcriptional regulator with XRE-family HTH domain
MIYVSSMNMGEKIRLLRTQRKFTQNKLGEMLNIDGKRISYYENGTHVPSTEVLVKLSEIFGVTMDYLVRDNAENLVINKVSDLELLKMFERVDLMEPDDKIIIKGVIETFVLKYKYKELSSTA